ncbi:MAG: alanine racemase [Candidatus Acidulodesulfobacterium acidiphilum]|uniref:Alanine racemase n=1 Tax=Candidatus Acidulodesulfobacterium acidiphilum TaxID=2597224 RepID=A0A520XET6_9DELT|nr:MAG: alanine racemase [Candidatus Acidulodesulfobacterium acidiphilum]
MEDTYLYINLNNLVNNLNFIKNRTSLKDKKIIAVIKSNAYGHGLLPIAESLFKNGIDFFGIIEIEEAENILKKIPSAKLLMLKGINLENLEAASALNLSIGVYSLDYLKELLDKMKSSKINKTLNLHLKFDSGMSRLGLVETEMEEAARIIGDNKKYFNLEGLFSHLSYGNNLEYTNYQINNFKKIISVMAKYKITPQYIHISASSSILNGSLLDDCSNAVRPGILLYGFNPNKETKYGINNNKNSINNQETDSEFKLEQLMTLKSKILQIKNIKKGSFVSYNNTFRADRDMTIGIVSAGYDNGIPRLLSNKGRFLINGGFAPIIGIVTMNMTIVDVSEIKNIKAGDEVIITGKDGLNEIKIEEIASLSETIPYEICLNFGKSNKKIYV